MNLDVVARSKINSLIQSLSKQVKIIKKCQRIWEKIVDNHIYKRVREYIIWAGIEIGKKFAIINDFETSLLILLLKKTGKR